MLEKTPKVAKARATTRKPIQLAKSQVSTVAMNDVGILVTNEIDEMKLPSDYHKLIKMCRFFYTHDPIAGTVMNKMVDCAITPLTNRKSNCTDEEFATYNFILDLLQDFFRNVCLEYLLSGLVIPQYEWSQIKGSELSPARNARRRVWVPANVWFRDPATITVRNSPTNKKYIYVTVDAATIRFIKSGGKLEDGTMDKELYEEFVKNYPEFVKAVKALKGTVMKIRLEDVRPIFSRMLPESTYPIPYMENALESLLHKRNLRKMDYSIAARVIAAIQVIKLGSDEFPCTDEHDFDSIKEQMNYRLGTGYPERVYQLFSNHTLDISWVYPDTAAMLNREKYSSVEDDIIAGLGFPRTLITGETLRSNVAGGSDFAAFSPIATMETIRDRLLEWTKVLYKEIQEKNHFANRPLPAFSPMKLYKLLDLNTIGESLYSEGSLSRQTRLEMQGLDLETEVERRKEEDAIWEKEGLTDAPALPFSSPRIGTSPGKEVEEE